MKTLDRRRFLLSSSALGAVGVIDSLASLAHAQAARARTQSPQMPVIFVGHGSPMNAIEDNEFTRRLAAWGGALPRPAAILSVSAHWLSSGVTAVNIQDRPETIHDFGGFPKALFDLRYPAPGQPAIAREAASLVRQTPVVPTEQWGLDHGTWTVLRHLYPRADVPVFQLSIDYARPAAFHYAVGRDLSALRGRGVLVMGSGNVAHNLGATDRGAPAALTASRPWAQSFDDAVKAALAGRDDRALIEYAKLAGASVAVATPDHYFPLLYALGASGQSDRMQTIYEGFQAGTISMRCLQFG